MLCIAYGNSRNGNARLFFMKTISFVIGSSNISGGTYVILQHALYLQRQGYDIHIICQQYEEYQSFIQSGKIWNPGLTQLKFISLDIAKTMVFDCAIFTWWKTILNLPDINATRYVYFVQSIESRFYSAAEQPYKNLVDDTYKLNLPVITEAVWIRDYLKQHYGSDCHLVRNGIRKDLYTTQGAPIAPLPKLSLRILVEGPLGVPFKNVERTIALCKKANVGEVWLLTGTPKKSVPGVARVFSCVPINEVPSIYRSCDVLVKLSYVEGMFGPPLEMFHCGGTAIVYNVTGHDEYITHQKNALVADTDDEAAVINYLRELNSQREKLQQLKAGALQTAADWIDWDTSSQQFMQALEDISDVQPEQYQIYLNKLQQFYKNFEIELEQFSAGKKSHRWLRYFYSKLPVKFRILVNQLLLAYRTSKWA